MADLFCKARYFRINEAAPKNSCFKGTVTPQTIFGGSGSYFDYCERYINKEDMSLMNYTGRYGCTMSSQGYLDTPGKSRNFKQKGIEALSRDGAVVYEIVCSMQDYEKAGNYNLTNQEQFASAISSIMPVYLKSIGLDPDNVSWWEDFHPENRTSTVPHPHIHLLFFENEPSHTFDRTYGKLSKKALADFKRMFANEMLKREDQSFYRNMFNEINGSRKTVVEKLKHTDLSNVKSVRDLYAVLPKSGRLQINSANMAPYRETIYRVVDSLLHTKDLREQWNDYMNSLDRYESSVNKKVNSSVSSRKEDEIIKIKEQIANYILSSRKGYMAENKYEKILENRNHSLSEGNAGRIYKDTEIVRSRLNSRNSDIPIRKGIGRLLAKRQREIEQEIEQYLNQDSYSMYM